SADPDLPPAPRPVVDHLPAELMTEDDALVGAHEALVAGLGHDLGSDVGVPARVEVGAADAAAPHVDQHLPLGRLRRRQVDDLQLRVSAGARLHRPRRCLKGWVPQRKKYGSWSRLAWTTREAGPLNRRPVPGYDQQPAGK